MSDEAPLLVKPKRSKRILFTLLGIGLMVMLVWASYTWWQQQQTLAELKQQLSVAEEKVKQAEQKQAELEAERIRLHDPEYISEIARRDYYLSRHGEVIFKVVE